jgi:hypothetical protein
LAQEDLYWLYCDPFAKYELVFHDFNLIEVLVNDSLPLSYLKNLNGKKDVIYLSSQEEILGFSTTTHCNYLSNLTTI